MYEWNGANFALKTSTGNLGNSISGLSVQDLYDDGHGELIVGTYNKVYMFKYDNITNNLVQLYSANGLGTYSSPKDYGDFYGTGIPQLIIGSSDGSLGSYELGANNTLNINWYNNYNSYRASPRLADLENTGILNIVSGEQDGIIRSYNHYSYTPEWSSTSLGTYVGSWVNNNLLVTSPLRYSASLIMPSNNYSTVYYYVNVTGLTGINTISPVNTVSIDRKVPIISVIDNVSGIKNYLEDELVHVTLSEDNSLKWARIYYGYNNTAPYK